MTEKGIILWSNWFNFLRSFQKKI